MSAVPSRADDGATHDEVLAAVEERGRGSGFSGYSLFGSGQVHAVIPRGPGFIVVVTHDRVPGKVGVPFLWPTPDFEGDSTGEPQGSLEPWVVEVFMVLDEMFDTEPEGNLVGELDTETGYPVIGLRRFLASR